MSLSAKEEQRLIDQAVDEHLAAIVILKRQRNRFAPVSRLPPEILSWILSCVKLALQDYSYHKLTVWIRVTHVSTHWRSVALNSPTLWNDPPLENGKWLPAMLERSKTVGLRISTDLSTQVSREGLETILRQHGSRIRHLAVIFDSVAYSRGILENLVSAPQLEVLSLCASPEFTNREDICIPKTVLNNLDNLRQLTLSSCNAHWHCFCLSNVTHLTIHDIACTARPTWTQFMDALAKMSKLESLDLESILDPATNFTVEAPSGYTHLLHLKSLMMESPTTEVELFFRHVTFSSSTEVYVKEISRSRSISDVSAVVSSIAQHFSGRDFLTLSLRKLGLCEVDFLRFQLLPGDSERSNDTYVNTRGKGLILEFVINRGEDATVNEIIPEFFKNGLPLDKIIYAKIASMHILNSDTLADTIGSLPALSRFRVEQETSATFINALYPRSNALDTEYFPLYFRNLVSISLSVTFERKSKSTGRDEFDVDLELLEDCLIQRYECGAEIKRLTLDDCYCLDESGVRELEKIVVDVVWDRIVQGFEEEEESEVDKK